MLVFIDKYLIQRDMKLIELVQLNEATKPVLDISALEREYKDLPPRAKEVMPANVKEWHFFQKQIDNLWKLYDEIKSSSLAMNSLKDYRDSFNARILQDMPFKHSLLEVITVKLPSITDYLFRNGFDISQYHKIFAYGKAAITKTMIANDRAALKNSLSSNVPSITVDNLGKAIAQLRVLNPSTITLLSTRQQPVYLEFKHVEWLNSIKNLALILGPVKATSDVEYLRPIVDTKVTTETLPSVGKIDDISALAAQVERCFARIAKMCVKANHVHIQWGEINFQLTATKEKVNGLTVVARDGWCYPDPSQFVERLKAISPKITIVPRN